MIALDFELAALVELCVFEADAAELEVAGEHAAVVRGERGIGVALFVDHLRHADHLVVRVLDRQAQHRARVVARHHVHVVVEALVLLFKTSS